MNVKVTGCKDCIFKVEYNEDGFATSYQCMHPNMPNSANDVEDYIYKENKLPVYCPLNKEPITIEKA